MDETWIEFDCPQCGMDYDLSIDLLLNANVMCACGYEISNQELKDSIRTTIGTSRP